MNQSTFYKYLFIVFSLTTSIEYILRYALKELCDYDNLFWTSHVFFILLTMVIYYGANFLAVSENKNYFSGMVLLVILTKMLSCVLIVVGYHQKMNPKSQLFLVPFIIVYVFYTVFETYFMSKIGYTVSPRKNK